MPPRHENQLHQFGADLDAFAKLIDVQLGTVVRKVAVDLHDKIVRRTPVDTGRARASWTMSLDTPQGAGDPGPVQDAKPAPPDPAVLSALQADPYRQVWIFSNVVYILALEHGHSKKAAQGMVAISLAEAEAEIDREIARRS
jgi:hypothetical protein